MEDQRIKKFRDEVRFRTLKVTFEDMTDLVRYQQHLYTYHKDVKYETLPSYDQFLTMTKGEKNDNFEQHIH